MAQYPTKYFKKQFSLDFVHKKGCADRYTDRQTGTCTKTICYPPTGKKHNKPPMYSYRDGAETKNFAKNA